MAGTPLLLLMLSALCACCTAQYTLTPGSPSVSVAPGGTVTLSCTVSGLPSIESKYPHWYQQKRNNAPMPVIYSNGASASHANNRPAGIPARFSGAVSGGTMSLTVAGAQAADDAVYICGAHHWEGSVLHFIFGLGTQMNVNTGETKAPTLSIFPPSTEEIAGKKATLVCQGQNYYPASLVWSWTMNGQTINTGVDSTRPTKQTENNLFMAASFLSIDAVDWNANKLYTCIATHEGKAFQASVKQSECV